MVIKLTLFKLTSLKKKKKLPTDYCFHEKGAHYSFAFFQVGLFFCFVLFWLHWVFVAACWCSLVAAREGYSSLQYVGYSLRWLLLLRSTGSRCTGFSSCGVKAQQLWCVGLVTPRHVESSRIRDRTRVLCTGSWILNHCTTREVQKGAHYSFMAILTGISKKNPRS